MDYFYIVMTIDSKVGSYFIKPVYRPYVYNHEKVLPDSDNIPHEQRQQTHIICIYHESIHRKVKQTMEKDDVKLNVLYVKPFYYVLITEENQSLINCENIYPEFHVCRERKYYQSYLLPDDLSTVRCMDFSVNKKCLIV